MEQKWWHDKVAYQIYPKSFYDSNGDGIGDIPGIISKIDYLKDLGVDILWISPCYPSPFADQGYDISDYRDINPAFGTLDDMDRLIEEAKKRDMYIVLDLVVNHCSDEHEWFQKACRDPEGKYGKFFYILPKKDKLPCNWRSYFGGSCWEELPGNPDYQYLHVFHKKQPDLNWENPELRREIYDMINWWFERGISGFRIDAIINIKKMLPFSDYPADREDGLSSIQYMLKDAHGIGEFLGEMRDYCFAPHNAFTVGEVFNEKDEELPDFIGNNGYFSSMFDFSTAGFGHSDKGAFDRREITAEDYKKCFFHSQKRLGEIGFYSNIIENHDEPRGVSRYIPAEDLCDRSKKALAAVYFFVRGIPFIYQGQEIGMENIPHISSIDEVDDISARDEYRVAMEAGLSPEEALQAVAPFSRDNARTPVQWSSDANAGFSTGVPWLPVNENYKRVNVESQKEDPNSVLSWYRAMTGLRKREDLKETMIYGEFAPYLAGQKNLIAYTRTADCKILVASNFQKEPQKIQLPGSILEVLLNNAKELSVEQKEALLEGYQTIVVRYE